jgi:flagellar basal body P-ring formation protein FlgA
MRIAASHFVVILLVGLLLPQCLWAGAGVVVKEAEVRQLVVDYVKMRTAALGLEVTVKKVGATGDLQLPAGTIAYEIVAPKQWEGWGNANLALIVRVDDRVVKNIPLRVEVEALTDLVVATRPLERGEVIGAADVVLQKRDLAGVTGKVSRSLPEVVGKQLKVGIRGNMPVRSDYLERVPLVKSGQMVTMVLESESLRVTMSGRVKSAGAEGDLILVQNLSSNKDVPARVVDSQTVRVDF